jgi:hypothetical protein
MLWFRGHCPDCDHVWDGEERIVDCGLDNYPAIDTRLIWSLFQATQELSPTPPPRGRIRSLALAIAGFGRFCREAYRAGTFFHHPKTYRCYFCPRCIIELRLPRRLNRRFWLAWVSENAHRIGESPLLFSTCERVACILAGARSNSEPVAIDLAAIVCPDCGDRMAIGEIHANPVVCPRCQGRSARCGEHRITTIDPPPRDDEADRRMIAHLKGLAKRPRGSHPEGALTPASFDDPAPLWDRDLDG